MLTLSKNGITDAERCYLAFFPLSFAESAGVVAKRQSSFLLSFGTEFFLWRALAAVSVSTHDLSLLSDELLEVIKLKSPCQWAKSIKKDQKFLERV
jgi:hypothetical protein